MFKQPFQLPVMMFLVVTSAAFFTAVLEGASGEEEPKKDDRQLIQPLLEQRRDVLKELVRFLDERYRTGTGTLDDVFRAHKRLASSQLDMARTPQERIAALRELVSAAAKIEAITKARYQEGRVSVAASLSAQASLLDARIRLKREQLRQPE